MILQRKNKPLASIGWLYLASILTILGQDRAAWAWTKVQLHQPDRWTSYAGYARASHSDIDSSLDANLKVKLDAIKQGEEYAFWDGFDINSITGSFPDFLYLPSYATMGCDGRNCRATANEEMGASPMTGDALQIPAQYTNPLGTFTPAQNKWGLRYGYWQRIPFWVCRDCLTSKLCVTCYTRLQEEKLSPMGCGKDHEGVFCARLEWRG